MKTLHITLFIALLVALVIATTNASMPIRRRGGRALADREKWAAIVSRATGKETLSDLKLKDIFKYIKDHPKSGKASDSDKKKKKNNKALSDSFASAATKLSNSAALSKIKSAGIGIVSSGGCHTKNNPRCTSLDRVNSKTISGIVAFKKNSKCSVTITGGTETGHASGTKSHGTGYKLDISLNTCVNSYITKKYKYAGRRSDGAAMYKSGSTIYAKEGNHWDILFV
jgi:hypothetical protein